MNIVFYDSNTGEINRVVFAGSPENISANTEGESNYIITSSDVSALDKRVVNNEIVSRPVFDITTSGNIISGVPAGATIKIHSSNIAEQEFTADGTDITITPEIPGIYTVKINLWPYQEEEITIEYNG